MVLVANHLDDAKTLALAACVCKSWCICMSSDHLWKPICAAIYPSLSNLRTADATLSYHKLYTLGYLSDKRRLQIQKPIKPRLSLGNLIFAIDIYNNKSCLLTIVKSGAELGVDNRCVFRFDLEINDDKLLGIDVVDNLRITWNVVLDGFKSVFSMMDCRGKGNFVLGLEGWFSKELPSSGCCTSSEASGLVAELRLGVKENGGKIMVEKMSVGVLSIVSWRYIWIDDALRYLEHFLLQ